MIIGDFKPEEIRLIVMGFLEGIGNMDDAADYDVAIRDLQAGNPERALSILDREIRTVTDAIADLEQDDQQQGDDSTGEEIERETQQLEQFQRWREVIAAIRPGNS